MTAVALSPEAATTPPGEASAPRLRSWWPLLSALAVYAGLMVHGVNARKDAADADGVAYIRNAIHLAEGRPALSVSGYWSPLISWTIAPLYRLTGDGLLAGRIAVAMWGAVLLTGISALAGSLGRLQPGVKWLVLTLAALAVAGWATLIISPDVTLAALLAWYFAVSIRHAFITSHGTALLAGLLGGAAFLAKSYAFPFFLAHHTLNAGLHWAFGRPRVTAGRAAAAWLVGLLGFAAVAGPWVGVLSAKYGGLTYSKAAALNHYLVGGPLNERNLVFRKAQLPQSGRTGAWETPEALEFESWSPLTDAESLKRQVRHSAGIILGAWRLLTAFDWLTLTPGIVSCAVLAALAGGNRDRARRFVTAVLTMALYVGGLSPVLVSAGARHLAPVLWPIACVLAFTFVAALCGRIAREAGGGVLVRLAGVVLMFGLAAFYAVPLARAFVRQNSAANSERDTGWRQFGEAIRSAGVNGPMSAAPLGWRWGTAMGWHAGMPFRGEVTATTIPEVVAELRRVGAVALVADGDWSLVGSFGRESGWRLAHTAEVAGQTFSLFVAP